MLQLVTRIRCWWSLLLLILLSCRSIETERPNMLFVVMDDLGYGQFGIYNDHLTIRDFDPYFTYLVDSLQGYSLEKALEFTKRAIPTMSQLAKEGLIFSRAFTSSNVCAPSRLGMATGILQNRWGIYTNRDCENSGLRPGSHLAERLQGLDYKTAHIGKWHIGKKDNQMVRKLMSQHDLDPDLTLAQIRATYPQLIRDLENQGYFGSVVREQHPLQNGFDYYYGYNYWASQYYNATNVWQDYVHAGKQQGYNTDVFTEQAIDFMEQQLDDKHTFFVQLHYHAVHDSVEPKAPDKYLDHFDAESHELNNFYAHIFGVDSNIGRIIDFLKSRGEYENTLIIFTSDNGAMCGGVYDGHKSGSPLPGNAPYAGQKGTYFQGGIRVPMFMHWPVEIREGAWSDALVSTMDILPTAIEAAGGVVPENIDGKSLFSLYTEESSEPIHDHLVWSGAHSYRWGFLVTRTTKTHANEFGFAPPSWAIIRKDYLLRFTGSLPPGIYLDHISGRGPALIMHHLEKDPAERTDLSEQYPKDFYEMAQLYYETASDFPPPVTWDKEKWREMIDVNVLHAESLIPKNE
ncbi:MAG: sulfatase-like hydrolase/transferase [Saprospiraceae bacterium]|nr:sulfatase-like hydrolase/transferase [Saprospiraceae bacterium]